MKKFSFIFAVLVILFTLGTSRGDQAIPINQCANGYTMTIPYLCFNVAPNFSNITLTGPPAVCTAIDLKTTFGIPKDAKVVLIPVTWSTGTGVVSVSGVEFFQGGLYIDSGCTTLISGNQNLGIINIVVTNNSAINGNFTIFAGGQENVFILLNGNTTIYGKALETNISGCTNCIGSYVINQPFYYTTN